MNISLDRRSSSNERTHKDPTESNSTDPLMHKAIRNGKLDSIRSLIEQGCSIEEKNKKKNSPLHLASSLGRDDVVRMLCSAGALIDARNEESRTPLHCATCCKQLACVQELLRAGARADLTDRLGETILHLACWRNDQATIKFLCTFGQLVNTVNSNGDTPLHIAAKHGCVASAQLLLLAGADPSVKNRHGHPPDVMAYAGNKSQFGMLLTRMKPERQKQWTDKLLNRTLLMPRIRLKLFGSSRVGKSQLVESLRSTFLSGFIRKKWTSVSEMAGLASDQAIHRSKMPYEWNREPEHENYTRGINISSCGEYSYWEFSGYEPYYFIYDQFIGDPNCIHLVVFSLFDDSRWQRASVQFWLDFIYSRIPVAEPILFAGQSSRIAKVLLIATGADFGGCLKNSHGLFQYEGTQDLLDEMKELYRYKLDIADHVHIIDARDSTSIEMKQLKVNLSNYRNSLVAELHRTNHLLIDAMEHLAEFVSSEDQPSFLPIETWNQFKDRIQQHINPLCTEEYLTALVQDLQYTGSIIYIEGPYGNDLIILNPDWFGRRVLGRGLEYDSLRQLRITGSFTLDDLQLSIQKRNCTPILRILTALEICVCCTVNESTNKSVKPRSRSRESFEDFFAASNRPTGQLDSSAKRSHKSKQSLTTQTEILSWKAIELTCTTDESDLNDLQIELPRLIQIPAGAWLWRPTKQAMHEVRLELSAAGLGQLLHYIPRLQAKLRLETGRLGLSGKDLMKQGGQIDSYDHLDLAQWLHGSKIRHRRGLMEILITLDEIRHTIHFIGRCVGQHSYKTLCLLYNVLNLVRQHLASIAPSLELTVHPMYGTESTDRPDQVSKPWDYNQAADLLISLFNLDRHSADSTRFNKESCSHLDTFVRLVREQSNQLFSESSVRQFVTDLFLGDLQFLRITSELLNRQPMASMSSSALIGLIRLLDLSPITPEQQNKLASYLSVKLPPPPSIISDLVARPSQHARLIREASANPKNTIASLVTALRQCEQHEAIRHLCYSHILLTLCQDSYSNSFF